MTLHIHAPQPIEKRIVRTECPTCERRTYFVAFFTEWYGWAALHPDTTIYGEDT